MSRRHRRRLLRAACLAAALVTAGPLPAAHAEPTTPTTPVSPEHPAAPDTPTAPGTPAEPHAPAPPAGATALAAAAPATPTEPVGVLLTRLQGLYQQAEQATEAYNAAETALTARRGEERRLSTGLGKARTAVSDARATTGRLAREQYQGARGFSPYARMLFSGDPQGALDQRRIADREGARRAAALDRLTRGERQADALAAAARKALDSEQRLAAETRKHKEEAAARLKEVERLLASLTPAQRGELGTREAEETDAAQRALIDSGKLGARSRPPTAAGGSALTYATAQLGKPYVWGPRGRPPSTAPG